MMIFSSPKLKSYNERITKSSSNGMIKSANYD